MPISSKRRFWLHRAATCQHCQDQNRYGQREHHSFSLIGSNNAVNRLPIFLEEILQLKSFAIEESSLDSDVIAGPKRAETINIRSPSIVGERNDDPLSGLIAYFEGAVLEVQLLHPPIERLDPATWTGTFAPTLIPILDTFLNAD
jgi:hypothetical protein